MTYGLVRRDISKKLPSTPEELLQYFRKELLDSYRQCREVVNRLVDDIDNGFVHLGDVIIREVAAAADLAADPALSDPVGSFALTPTGVYFKNTLGWIFLGPILPSGTVTDETSWDIAPAAGTPGTYSSGDHTHGSPPEPVTSLASSDGFLVVSAATGAVDLVAGPSAATASNIETILEALDDVTRILKAIDDKLAVQTGTLPFDDDEGGVFQRMTTRLVSIDSRLARETGTLPFDRS